MLRVCLECVWDVFGFDLCWHWLVYVLNWLKICVLCVSNGLNWEVPDNPSQPLLPGWYALLLICISSWGFFSFFWIRGKKTLGMAVWKIEIYSIDSTNITLMQTLKRFICNIIIVATLGLPLLQIYFTKEKIAFNDIISRTRLRIR